MEIYFNNYSGLKCSVFMIVPFYKIITNYNVHERILSCLYTHIVFDRYRGNV